MMLFPKKASEKVLLLSLAAIIVSIAVLISQNGEADEKKGERFKSERYEYTIVSTQT